MTPDADLHKVQTSERLGRWISFLTLAAVFFHATQASYDLFSGRKDIHLNVCVADVLIGTAFGLWILRRVKRKDFSVAPLTVGAVVGAVWLALSLIPFLKGASPDHIQVSLTLGLVKVAQFVEYFIAGYILFAECFRDERQRRWMLRLLVTAILVNLTMAWIQYFSRATTVTEVRGAWFANRNTLGAFLALSLPLVFGHALFARSRVWLLGAVMLAVASLAVMLAGGTWMALSLGLLVVAAFRGRTAYVVTAVVLVVLGLFILPHLPRQNAALLRDSVALFKESDPYRIFGGHVTAVQRRFAEKQRALATKVQDKTPVTFEDLPQEDDYSWKWQQRYKEWQAVLNMMARSPVFGVGAGSYQNNVDQFYYDMPKYPETLLEPDTLSGYFVWGANAGVPFIVIMLALFLRGLTRAGRALCGPLRSSGYGLAAGVIGSIVALALTTVFTDPMVRGVGVTLVLILALAESLVDECVTANAVGESSR